jgi:hypothetical protein
MKHFIQWLLFGTSTGKVLLQCKPKKQIYLLVSIFLLSLLMTGCQKESSVQQEEAVHSNA